MAFSDKLYRFVKENHLNQAAVARDMGIESSKLNATVNGKRKMDVDEYINFCKAVNIDPLLLLRE